MSDNHGGSVNSPFLLPPMLQSISTQSCMNVRGGNGDLISLYEETHIVHVATATESFGMEYQDHPPTHG